MQIFCGGHFIRCGSSAPKAAYFNHPSQLYVICTLFSRLLTAENENDTLSFGDNNAGSSLHSYDFSDPAPHALVHLEAESEAFFTL